ncbi:MAG: hypothetical protein JW838_11740 [Spirochaetes bacterium]|nr:hypothetical protein [Spirochaetota bacterium]
MKPARTASIVLLLTASLLLILSAAAGLFIFLYPKERLLAFATSRAGAALGRSVSVRDIGYRFVGLSLEGVEIHDGDESSPVLICAERAHLNLSPLSLLQMRIEFDSVTLQGMSFTISFDGEGRSNVEKLLDEFSRNDGSGVDATLARLRLTDARLVLSAPPPRLASLEGEYRLDALIQFGGRIKILDCEIILPEKRGILRPELSIEPGNDPAISGKLKLVNTSLGWAYRWAGGLDLPFRIVNGVIDDLSISGTMVKGAINASSTLQGTDAVFRAAGIFNVNIPGRTVSVGPLRGSVGDSSFHLDSLIIPMGKKPSRFRISSIDASMRDIAPLLPFIPARLAGRIRGDLRFEKGLYNGTVSMSEGGYDPEGGVMSGLNAQIEIIDGRFNKSGIPFLFLGNPCVLSIASTDSSLSRIFVTLRSDTFQYDIDSRPSSGTHAPLNIPIEITGLVEVRRLTIGRHDLDGLKLRYRLAGNSLTISDFRFSFAGGDVTGRGVITLAQGPPKLSLSMGMQNISIQDALAHNDTFRNRFFGIVKGKGAVDTELSERILDSAVGAVEFSIERGKLVDTGIQNGLGILLSELRYKIRDIDFNTIYGNVGIRGTNYLVNSFVFNSHNLRFKINGSFDRKLIANPLNITLEFTRDFIQDLPGVITPWLGGYLSGEWYSVPFVMTGDMTDGKNLRRAD